MDKYPFLVVFRHDSGISKLKVLASGAEVAKQMVIKAEGCPECAIISVKIIKKISTGCVFNITEQILKDKLQKEHDALPMMTQLTLRAYYIGYKEFGKELEVLCDKYDITFDDLLNIIDL